MDMIKATRYHDFSAGHRVVNHESKCAHLHGHNYRVTFEITGELDNLGRVMDFSVIKSKLCMWLEDNWDHKMIIYSKDPLLLSLLEIDPKGVVEVNFNPTAENMAEYLVKEIGPAQLQNTGCKLVKCIIEETRKCSASYEIKSI
jgi:6-pyruvoyltetrahydropterin/6-carboxytetrahydropterin synthase